MKQSAQPARRIVLVNPNTDEAMTRMMVAIAQEAATTGVHVEGVTALFGAPLITNPAALARARDAVLSIPKGTFDGAKGVLVSAFGDPGANELRSCLSVPVVGLAEASMCAAADLGRFSIATTTPGLAQAIRQKAAEIGVAEELVSVRTTQEDPATLMRDGKAVLQALESIIKEAIARDDICSVIIGGGPLGLAARDLVQRIDIPVLEPIPIAIRSLIENRTLWR